MADEKITNFSTLASPSPAPVFDAVVTNDGTTTANWQRPQGQIVQPDVNAAATTAGAFGVVLIGGNVTNVSSGTPSYSSGGPFLNKAGNATGSGNPVGGYLQFPAGNAYLTGAGTAKGGYMFAQGGGAYVNGGVYNLSNAEGGRFYTAGGSATYTGLVVGGGGTLTGGNATGVVAGNTVNAGGITLSPGAAGGSGTLADGSLYFNLPHAGSPWVVKNLATADPHVLGQEWCNSLTGAQYCSRG